MSHRSELAEQSPFDRMKRVDSGEEFWKMSELFMAAGLSWSLTNRASLVTRAQGIVALRGEDSAKHIRGHEGDIALSRLGAYVVLLAVPDSSPQMDAALAYFSALIELAARAPVDVSPLGQLKAIVGTLEAHQVEIAEVRARVEIVTSRMDAHEDTFGWMAAAGYAAQHGLRSDEDYLRDVGTQAGILGRARGLAPGKARHRHYGYVNTWPDDVWARAFAEVNDW